MPRTNGPPALNLSAAVSGDNGGDPPTASTLSPTSPRSPRSPSSGPGSPYLHDASMGRNTVRTETIVTSDLSLRATTNGPGSPSLTAVPQYPSSPPASPKHGRDTSKSFFSNLMASKSSHRLQSPDRNGNEPSEKATSKSRASSKDRTLHSLRSKISTPDLPKNTRAAEKGVDPSTEPQRTESVSQSGVEDEPVQSLSNRRMKPRFGGLLSRTKSIRIEDDIQPRLQATDRSNMDPPLIQLPDTDPLYGTPLKSAPLQAGHRDRAFNDTVGSSIRNRSADRTPVHSQESSSTLSRRDKPALAASSSFRDGAGAHILSNIHQTGKGMGARLGTAGKGFLGKITRSSSSNERDLVTDDNYHCTVITLPLVQQTRRTRIAKRMELSRDKTEYWMPALPWRCIEYVCCILCHHEFNHS